MSSTQTIPPVGTRDTGGAVVVCGGAGRPDVFPPSTIATAVALLNATVILINKHLHLCILLCEPGRVLRQAVRLKTRATFDRCQIINK